MTYYCVTGDHEHCPDSKEDSLGCSCPCHISHGPDEEVIARIKKKAKEGVTRRQH